MRGVLACIVMLFHYGLNSIIQKITGGLLQGGEWTLCVDFFFLLSGFVIALSFSKELPSLRLYAAKRLRRLAPAFLITTAWAVALPPHDEPLGLVLINFAMVQSLFHMQSINGPSWSVPFELFLPAVALVFWRSIERAPRVIITLCWLLGGIAGVQLARGVDWPWLRASVGIAGGFALFQVRNAIPRFRFATPVAVALFAGCIGVMLLAKQFPWSPAIFTPLSMATVLIGAQSRSFLSTWPFQALGRWSYSIYLVHSPMIVSAIVLLGSNRVDGSAAVKGSLIVLTLALSAVLFRFVERPLMWQRPGAAPTAP